MSLDSPYLHPHNPVPSTPTPRRRYQVRLGRKKEKTPFIKTTSLHVNAQQGTGVLGNAHTRTRLAPLYLTARSKHTSYEQNAVYHSCSKPVERSSSESLTQWGRLQKEAPRPPTWEQHPGAGRLQLRKRTLLLDKRKLDKNCATLPTNAAGYGTCLFELRFIIHYQAGRCRPFRFLSRAESPSHTEGDYKVARVKREHKETPNLY